MRIEIARHRRWEMKWEDAGADFDRWGRFEEH